MFIISSDKSIIVNVDNVSAIRVFNDGYKSHVIVDKVELATFETREEALEMMSFINKACLEGKNLYLSEYFEKVKTSVGTFVDKRKQGSGFEGTSIF